MTADPAHRRACLRLPIPEIERAAGRLEEAVAAHERGDVAAAHELLRLADDKVVWTWLDEVWGRTSRYNMPVHPSGRVPTPPGMRAAPRAPSAETKRLVHARDGYYCRFCKMPVIRREVRSWFRRRYPDAVPWEGTNAAQHAAFQCMWAQYDHVLPHAFGGTSEIDNVYLACAACNYGRSSHLLEEFDLLHPDEHPLRVGPWDGLERVLGRSRSGS